MCNIFSDNKIIFSTDIKLYATKRAIRGFYRKVVLRDENWNCKPYFRTENKFKKCSLTFIGEFETADPFGNRKVSMYLCLDYNARK